MSFFSVFLTSSLSLRPCLGSRFSSPHQSYFSRSLHQRSLSMLVWWAKVVCVKSAMGVTFLRFCLKCNAKIGIFRIVYFNRSLLICWVYLTLTFYKYAKFVWNAVFKEYVFLMYILTYFCLPSNYTMYNVKPCRTDRLSDWQNVLC